MLVATVVTIQTHGATLTQMRPMPIIEAIPVPACRVSVLVWGSFIA
jgi:hypothetical protein